MDNNKLWTKTLDRYLYWANSFKKLDEWCKKPVPGSSKSLCKSSRQRCYGQMLYWRGMFPSQRKIFDEIDSELGIDLSDIKMAYRNP